MNTIFFDKNYDNIQGIGNSAKLLFVTFINYQDARMQNLYQDIINREYNVNNTHLIQPEFGNRVLCLFEDLDSKKLFIKTFVECEENVKEFFFSVGKIFRIKVEM